MSELLLQDMKGEILKYEPDGETLLAIAVMCCWSKPESKNIAKELVRRWNAFPDLLAACEELFNDCRNMPADEQRQKVMQKAKAAIAKAKP